ncbi:MAG: polyketide cyclase [Chloroflexota bacterium]|jgi:hypothetical protein
MNANEYHFVTHWRVPGTVEEVAEILSDATDLPRWWPAVYLDVEETKPGDEDGIGKEVSLYTRGWLPYTLRWQFRVIESDYPHSFALESWGDFVGRGEWRLRQNGRFVDVTYDWRIQAEKPLLRLLSFLLRPIFAANHRWAMARGEESLHLELARRAAVRQKTSNQGKQNRPIPPPPGPPLPYDYLLPGLLILGGLLLLGWGLRRFS